MSELIAGVDEVGIGPLAGPVVAAAVILNPNAKIYKLRDSKILTPEVRAELFEKIYARAIAVSVGISSVEEINSLNIYHANMLAMKRALENLPITPTLVLIDGKSKPQLDLPIKTIVGGDRTEKCISAASIIAKVTRDKIMETLHLQYPLYNFKKHKGYSTKEHQKLLREHGPCEIHRKNFFRVKKVSELMQLTSSAYPL